MNTICWQSPSNIALVKYWGKHGVQLPRNASLSFTLSACHTQSTLHREEGSGRVRLTFNGEEHRGFSLRAATYIESLYGQMPFLRGLDLHIDSVNTFPHSAGIASSASAMSSLALCLCSLEEAINGTALPPEEFFRKASILARLGSGSASRSVYGGYVSWGQHASLSGSSDDYASPLPFSVHPDFTNMHDSILVVDRGTKAVSSSEGHRLMDGHPYAGQRYRQAGTNLAGLLAALHSGDHEQFMGIVENEALGLHGLMMSSAKSYVLLKPGTLDIIHRVREFRRESNIPLCFTLDAGPNVHLLYPAGHREAVQAFITQELLVYCSENYRIDDHIGDGPQKL